MTPGVTVMGKTLKSTLRAIAAKIPARLCQWHTDHRACSAFAAEGTPRCAPSV